jgi:hypothetical protein
MTMVRDHVHHNVVFVELDSSSLIWVVCIIQVRNA